MKPSGVCCFVYILKAVPPHPTHSTIGCNLAGYALRTFGLEGGDWRSSLSQPSRRAINAADKRWSAHGALPSKKVPLLCCRLAAPALNTERRQTLYCNSFLPYLQHAAAQFKNQKLTQSLMPSSIGYSCEACCPSVLAPFLSVSVVDLA